MRDVGVELGRRDGRQMRGVRGWNADSVHRVHQMLHAIETLRAEFVVGEGAQELGDQYVDLIWH